MSAGNQPALDDALPSVYDEASYRRLLDHAGSPGWTEKAIRSAEVIVRLLRTYGAVAEQLGKHLEEFGLTQPQFNVLMLLFSANQHRLPMRDIAEGLHVTRFNVTKLIDRMERDAVVKRTPATEDRRVIFVEMTEEGLTKLRRCLRLHWRRIDAMVSGLSVLEQDQLLALLAKLSGAVTRWQQVPHVTTCKPGPKPQRRSRASL